MKDRDTHFETACVHAGRHVDPATGAVAPPIHLSTTFERRPDYSPEGYIYGRSANPNREQLETCLAALEEGAAAMAFASGSAAASTVFQALKPGDHVVCTRDAYHNILRILREVMTSWSLKVSFVDACDLDAVRSAVTKETRLIWVESPSNPLLKITDLAAVAEIAHQAGAYAVCDSTFASPVLQRPLAFGIDLVMHSATKYLGGHSDVVGGVLVAREMGPLAERLRYLQGTGGAIPSPFDCWLVLRGTATLGVRVRAQSDSALKLARWLEQHGGVERVLHPGLESHPQHALAKRQMSGFGAMLSFCVHGGEAAAKQVAGRVKLFTRATSLGGVESLIEHRASVEGPESPTPKNLLRVSVGLEHPNDLIADLEQALA